MLITITRTLENNVHKAVVETEANALDQAYMKAYGEPKVSMGGNLSYPDSGRVLQNIATGDAVKGVEQDLPHLWTIVEFRAGAVDMSQIKVGDTLTFTDVTNQTGLNGSYLVMATDGIHNKVALNVSGIPTDTPFTTAVNIATVTIGAQIEGQALAGFTDDSTDLVLQLKTGTTLDLSLVTPNVDSIVIAGCTLAPALNGTHLITAVSIPSKTITIASLALTSQPTFEVSTPEGNLLHVPSPVQFVAPSSDVYVRSSSPFEFKLSQATDPAAAAKVKAWADDLKVKISGATLSLKAAPNPNTGYPIVESAEVV